MEPALGLLKTVPYTTFSDFDLCMIPLFVLMGNLAATSGLGASLYRTPTPGSTIYFITIQLIVRIKPDFGPPGLRTTIKEKVKSITYSWDVAALFILFIGDIYAGLFTPSEAAEVGAAGAFLSLILRGQWKWV